MIDEEIISGLLVILFYATVIILLFWGVREAARSRGRDPDSFTLIALLITPFIAYVILVIMGPNKEVLEEQRGERVRCPACAEWVQSRAVKCRYCGSELTPSRPVVTGSGPLGL